MLTQEDLQNIVDRCQFHPWKINLGLDGERFFIQVEDPVGTDNFTGEPLPWKSRKWFVSPHMCVSEVVRTCYKAVQNAMEHELDERFTYCGVAIYDPHRNVDLLVSNHFEEHALDTRDNRTSLV
jgi:hypothetical protein